MPIQLDRILTDIAEEKVLLPNYPSPAKKEVDEAWARVAKSNSLSAHETKSIFRVLQKKYAQERLKDQSLWKLFDLMDNLYQQEFDEPSPVKPKDELPDSNEEEEVEYDVMDVQDEEESSATAAASSPSANANAQAQVKTLTKASPKAAAAGKAEKASPETKKLLNTQAPTAAAAQRQMTTVTAAAAQKTATTTTNTAAAVATAAAALQKKGISVKKASSLSSNANVISSVASTSSSSGTGSGGSNNNSIEKKSLNSGVNKQQNIKQHELRNPIKLPESVKRKLSEEHQMSNLAKKQATAKLMNKNENVQHTTTAQLMQHKREQEDELLKQKLQQQQTTAAGINLITVPANPSVSELSNGLLGAVVVGGPTSSTAATVASTSTNGCSPTRIEEIDFQTDIIFDTGCNQLNGGIGSGSDDIITKFEPNLTKVLNLDNFVEQQQLSAAVEEKVNKPGEIINLGNFENALPPTFFKNLCNSSRHEALGLYVANVMNRLQARSAAKLELGILRAIIDVQMDDLEQQ